LGFILKAYSSLRCRIEPENGDVDDDEGNGVQSENEEDMENQMPGEFENEKEEKKGDEPPVGVVNNFLLPMVTKPAKLIQSTLFSIFGKAEPEKPAPPKALPRLSSN